MPFGPSAVVIGGSAVKLADEILTGLLVHFSGGLHCSYRRLVQRQISSEDLKYYANQLSW